MENKPIELSVVIPALHEEDNLSGLVPTLIEQLEMLKIAFELIVVDKHPTESMQVLAEQHQITLIDQETIGYANALWDGFTVAKGTYILTMDADYSHPPTYIKDMWVQRETAGIVIASRYVPGASYSMPLTRTVLSGVLNVFFSQGLSLGVRDVSSGYRLYRADVIKSLKFVQRDFSVLQEILVKVLCLGYKITEVPFSYKPRVHGSSHARVIEFGISYLKSFWGLYKFRNSNACNEAKN